MNATEYINEIINTSQDETLLESVQEDSAYEAAMLLSGSFIYPLYGALWVEHYDMDSICKKLMELYWTDNHYGFVYFIALLANAVDYEIPTIFTQMSANDKLVPILSSAVLDDWIDYDITTEPEAVS